MPAEAAERHFRRAKDATKLLVAVELKLTEQRKFVLWWDGQIKHRGGRPSKNSSQTSEGFRLRDFGLYHEAVRRWRRLKDEDTFKRALERSLQLVEFTLHQGTKSESTENPEWYTPAAGRQDSCEGFRRKSCGSGGGLS